MKILHFLVYLFAFKNIFCLYPRETATREVKILDGIWNFRLSPQEDQNIGFTQRWFDKPLAKSGSTIPMPVPASFNDITQERSIRDYVGWVWYDTTFRAYDHWKMGKKRIKIRFGSVHYIAVVFINGQNIVNHTGGHLPFETEITKYLNYGAINLLTVAVNNTLTPETVPQGQVEYKSDINRYPKNFYEVKLNFDFFNYAGIHRSVHLSILPSSHIIDVNFIPGILDAKSGMFDYSIIFEAHEYIDQLRCELEIWDKLGEKLVAKGKGCSGNIVVKNATFWWPISMHSNPGYLYNIKTILKNGNKTVDEYVLKTGIRTIKVSNSSFLINNEPFYFKGFGKHEDANIRGRGLDLPLIIKDFNLIKWINANAFRTSHYPYAEELMDQADEHGIVVIDECPAVGLSEFTKPILRQHIQTLKELFQRDKNRPSVVMWSIANEPKSQKKESETYFEHIVLEMKTLDKTRPISAALSAPVETDRLAKLLDVLMINRYFAWYSDTGYTEVIKRQVITEFKKWHTKHNKVMLISEYGADTVAGLHQDPSFIFTEDYQIEFLMKYHEAFDVLRSKNFFVGELVWNFADFMTDQQINRVFGNRKGLFTRERHPKAAARIMRCRYQSLNDGSIFGTQKINHCFV